MFIATDNEREDFVNQLISIKHPKKILQYLKAQDQKQLLFAHNQLISKMPKELHLESSSSGKPQIEKIGESFPNMFESVDNKKYEYINENIQNMKQLVNNYSQMPKGRVQTEFNPLQQLHIEQRPEQSKLQPNQVKESSMKQSLAQPQKRPQSDFSLSFNKPPQPPKNPFIANNINFTDKYANSKSLKQKYQHLNFTDNSRNLAAIAQNAKQTAFSGSVAFPTTVMTGTIIPPRENTFAKNSKLDVEDVMRYTLGVKRSSSSAPMENPFLRIPRKRQN